MSASVVTNVVDQLREFGETRRGWLGVRIQDVDEDIAEGLGLADARGALVTDVPEGPALDAGIEVGDVILSFGGEEIEDTRELVRIVGESGVGETDPHAGLPRWRNPDPAGHAGPPRNGRRCDPAAPGAEPEARAERRDPRPHRGPPDRRDARAAGRAGRQWRPRDRGGRRVLRRGRPRDCRWATSSPRSRSSPCAASPILTERVAAAEDGGQKSILLLIRRAGNPRFVALALPE
jgi:serine protease Do